MLEMYQTPEQKVLSQIEWLKPYMQTMGLNIDQKKKFGKCIFA
jgi:hypothetical protein